MPIATSTWPIRQARPNVSEMITPGRSGQARAKLARGGVGIERQQHDGVVARDVRLVHAGIRAHEPVPRLADHDAVARRDDRR